MERSFRGFSCDNPSAEVREPGFLDHTMSKLLRYTLVGVRLGEVVAVSPSYKDNRSEDGKGDKPKAIPHRIIQIRSDTLVPKTPGDTSHAVFV